MNTQPHFTTPELGQTFTAQMARSLDWIPLTSTQPLGDYAVYALKRTAQTHYIVTWKLEIVCITSVLQVAAFASTIERRKERQKQP